MYVCVCARMSVHNLTGSPSCQMFEVGKDLLTKLVHQLIKAQVHLSLHLVVEKPLLEMVQSIVTTVTVQVQGVQDVPGGGGGGADCVCM